MTFRPMGQRLADVLVRNLNGDFDDRLDYNPAFAAAADAVVVVQADDVSDSPDIHEPEGQRSTKSRVATDPA